MSSNSTVTDILSSTSSVVTDPPPPPASSTSTTTTPLIESTTTTTSALVTSTTSTTTEPIPTTPTTNSETTPPTPPPPPPPTPTPTPTPTTTPESSVNVVTTIETSTVGGIPTTVTITITSTNVPTPTDPAISDQTPTSATTTSSGTAEAGGSKSGSSIGGGLNGPALIAVAVIVPVVILALIGVVLLFYFKKRRTDRNAQTKGPVAGGIIGGGAPPPDTDREGTYEMNEADGAGYRGWGSTVGGRKTTVASSSGYPMSSVGKTASDGGYSNSASVGPPGYTGNGMHTPVSPVYPDSTGLLTVDRAVPSPAFTESSTIGAMPTFDSHNSSGLNRGVSNASSNYSAMTHSDQSDFDQRQSQQYYGPNAQEYDGAYFSNGANMYYDDPTNPPPVIRDVQARRNTRIETPTSAHFPQQGSSGIAQNF